jgi:hypothetical protein
MKPRIIPLLGLLATVNLPAQSMEELMRKAMEQQGGQQKITIEENKDPFVPLTFTGSYRMEVHTYKSGKEEKDSPVNLLMAFKPDAMAMEPNSGSKDQARMVFDLKGKLMYTLMTDDKGQRSGIKMKMMKMNVEGNEGGPTKDAKVERTSETKVIDGRTCRKYTYSDVKGRGEAWVAEDVKWDMMTVLNEMLGGKGTEGWQRGGMGGLMMENTWNSADGKEKVVMYTRDVVQGKVNDALFSTAGYSIQDMSSFSMFGQ